jgi:hypothetical protein
MRIRHENPGVQCPSAVGDHLREQSHETPAISVIAEDVALLVAAAGDMPDGTRKLEAKLTGHGTRRERAAKRRPVRVGAFRISRRRAHEAIAWIVKLSFQM